MQIDVIEGSDGLAGFERNWRAVYDADPEAQFFLSWTWIAKFLSVQSGQFLALAARPDSSQDYVAFFPIGLGTTALEKGGFVTEVYMASAGAADYTGFICRPEFEDEAIPAFARTIASMRWANLHIEDVVASDRRFDLFFRAFPKTAHRTSRVDRTSPVDGVDSGLAPRIELPADWPTYLATKVSANTRHNIRRSLQEVEGDDRYRITHATRETIDRDVATLTDLWARQWRERKGERTDFMARFFGTVLHHCFEDDALFLPVLWHDDLPIAALALIVDHQQNSFLYFIGGRDTAHGGLRAGLVLHAHSIRNAIENGIATYDLLQGNERYKHSLGAEHRPLRNITVSTKSLGILAECLDIRCLPRAVDIALRQHRAGRLAQAERGYRQILAIAPHHTIAVEGYGRLLGERGNRAAADKLIKARQAHQR